MKLKLTIALAFFITVIGSQSSTAQEAETTIQQYIYYLFVSINELNTRNSELEAEVQALQASIPASYIVRDGEGNIIGPAHSVYDYQVKVRLVYVDEGSVEHGYTLGFTQYDGGAIEGYPNSIDPYRLRWDNSLCLGDAAYALSNTVPYFLEPFWSNEVKVIEVGRTSQEPTKKQFALARLHPPSQTLSAYYKDSGNCFQRPADSPEELMPITIEVQDLYELYPAPYTLNVE